MRVGGFRLWAMVEVKRREKNSKAFDVVEVPQYQLTCVSVHMLSL